MTHKPTALVDISMHPDALARLGEEPVHPLR